MVEPWRAQHLDGLRQFAAGNQTAHRPLGNVAAVFERHLNAGDLDAVLELYESEARFVAPSGEMIVGRNRIREVIAGLVQSKTKMTSRVVKAITLDNVTLLYTDFQGTTVDDSGETIELRSKAIELLRRQPDDTWKLIFGDPNAREGDVS